MRFAVRIVKIIEKIGSLVYEDGSPAPDQTAIQTIDVQTILGVTLAPIHDPKRVLRGQLLTMQIAGRADIRLGGNLNAKSTANLAALEALRDDVHQRLADNAIPDFEIHVLNLN